MYSSIVAIWLGLSCMVGASEPPAGLEAVGQEEGVLVRDGDQPVLFFQSKPKSQNGEFRRANYVHPLYDLDGNVLTEDFPADHRHHRGIFWTWHQVRIGDKQIGDPWVCRDFDWDVESVEALRSGQTVALHTRVVWKSPLWTDAAGGPKPMVREEAVIRVHPIKQDARKIDFVIKLTAIADDVSIGGSEDAKGYGGFSVRLRLPPGTQFQGTDGSVTPHRLGIEAGPWMDIKAAFGETQQVSGVAILCHPSLPGFPQPWILRQQRSMQNPAYPGRHAIPLSKSEPLVMRYRLVLHRRPVEPAIIDGWQEEYGRGTANER